MSDTTGPSSTSGEGATPDATPIPDATPTEVLQLADQQPVTPESVAAPAAHRSGGHTRTILEIVGGVVAAGLILVAAGVGFAIGHATSDGGGDRVRFASDAQADQRGQGLQGQQGQQGQGFQDPRGIDPDGDNWTGGGQGMMPGQGLPGQQGQGQGQQGQGFQDPRGIDPDGDNWTGGGQDMAPGEGQQAVPTAPATGSTQEG